MSEPIRPPNTGLTPEAEAALLAENPDLLSGLGDTSSAADDDGISAPYEGMGFSSTGDDIVDAELVEDDGTERGNVSDISPAARGRERRRQTGSGSGAREAKSAPPSVDEWTGFFSRVVLKLVTEYYISYAFRGVDEDMLSDREVERLALTEDERSLISVPLAEISNKSKFMRKHGRMIVASGDAMNAFVVLGMWMARVNRIATKYRPKVVKGHLNGSSGQATPPPNGSPTNGSTGGRFPEWYNGPIVPGSS